MTLKLSTGMRNGVLDATAVKEALDGGLIKIYSGAEPSSADDAVTGTLLVTISLNSTGTGITFEDDPVAGVLSKKSSEVWSGVNAATGTAGYFRHVATGDDGTSSTTQKRLQGRVAVAGAELNLSSVALTSGATQTIDYYAIVQPAY